MRSPMRRDVFAAGPEGTIYTIHLFNQSINQSINQLEAFVRRHLTSLSGANRHEWL